MPNRHINAGLPRCNSRASIRQPKTGLKVTMEDPQKGSGSSSTPGTRPPSLSPSPSTLQERPITHPPGFLLPNTSLLPATPEIALEFNTTSETLNITNAGVLVAMGLSTLLWGPLTILIGRRLSYNIAVAVLVLCSGFTAESRSMGMFTACRILSGFTATSFMVSGQTVLANIFEPEVRGTTVGFFMLGSVTGPAIGPCVGGVIVTFASWRYIYWLQTAMAGFGLVLSLIFVPEVQQEISSSDTEKEQEERKITLRYALEVSNPVRVFRLWLYPNVLFSVLSDLRSPSNIPLRPLSSVRIIFNPRFDLTTALVAGLFYLAPGSGFLVGSVLGGRLSDMTVRKFIARRGFRLPQDRLNSGIIMLSLVLPGATLVYAWTLDQDVGGMAVPTIAGFIGGVGLMGSFNGLNTYAAEALPSHRAEVIAGMYIIHYLFSAGASALVVPLIERIGVAAFLTLAGAVLVVIIARWGIDMQRWVERRVPIPKPS
ncbi:major facilitator superfamily domain-containing protein [Aspergillus desertorum]